MIEIRLQRDGTEKLDHFYFWVQNKKSNVTAFSETFVFDWVV